MDHPPEALLLRFVEGRADREEARRVVAHLLRGCLECGSVLAAARRAWRAKSPPRPIPESAYDEVFERLLERARTPTKG